MMRSILPLVVFILAVLACDGTSRIDNVTTGKPSSGPVLQVYEPRVVRSTDIHFALKGEVMNISDSAINAVRVLATFYDSSGNIVDTDSVYVEILPLMPGQKSPYDMIVDYNSAIVRHELKYLDYNTELTVREVPRVDTSKPKKK